MNIYCHIPEYQMYKNHGMLSMIPHFIKLDMVGICPEKGHWFKVHTASPGPTFSCRTRLSIDAHGTAQGQAKQIHSGMIFIHSPVVQLQTDDKNFDRSLLVTMVSFGFLFVMSKPQLPVLHPKPHGLS